MPGSFVGHAREVALYVMDFPPETLFEVRQRKRKRSLTQNAYYWAMVNKLARKLGYPDQMVHRWMLAEYGVSDVFSVRSDIPVEGYFRYFERVGTGYVNGREFAHVKVYKPSSQMDSGEFSRLIDGLRWECEAQGIPFMTPDEVACLKFAEPKLGG